MRQRHEIGQNLRGSIGLLGSLALSVAILQTAGAQDSPRRDGHKLIRTSVATPAQLQSIENLGGMMLNCEAHPGALDFVMAPDQLQALRDLGIAFDVVVEDVQAQIDAERRRIELHNQQAGPDGVSWFADFKTYPQVNAHIDDLVAMRPDLATKITIGTSIEGRTIYGLRITGAGAPPPGLVKPAVMFNGCQHAREWIAVMVPMYIADQLITEYENNARIQSLVDSVEFYIVPIVNPDGYEYTYAVGGDRLWRKNRRNNGGGEFGVDLNRNWAVDWNGGQSTSNDPGSDLYVGTGPFSEPETEALSDYMAARPQLIGHIDFHSYGQLVLQPVAHTHMQPVEFRLVDQISGILSAGIFSINNLSYSAGTGGTLLYLLSGSARDWSLVDQGIFGHTIELRNTSTFLLPPSQILPTCTEAFEGALRMAEWSLGGVQFAFTSGKPVTVEAGTPTPVRVELLKLTSGPLENSTAKLFSRIGNSGPFAESALAPQGGDKYLATLPAVPCGNSLEYYLEVQSTAGGTFRSPTTAPFAVHTVQSRGTQSVFADNFQTNMGWTASGVAAGAWQRGVPVNDVNWPYDPIADADGSGSCYLTQNTLGNSDVDGGAVILTSPIIDMSNTGSGGIILSYDYFLRLSYINGTDRLLVEINSAGGGGTWTPIATHTTNGSLDWRSHEIDQAALTALGVTMTSQMRVRFTANDATPSSMVEAGVDNFRVRRVMCNTPACAGDIVLSGGVDIDDLLAVIGAWGPCPAPPAPCPPDIAPTGGNGQVDINDLLAVIGAWGPCP